MYFSTLYSKALLELLHHPNSLCDRIFKNAVLGNLGFCHATGMF